MELLAPYMNYIITTLAVLAALILAIVIYRILSKTVKGRRGQRLGISEYHELDKSRRLVLIRRDGVEHLILIGGGQDIVIESGIDHNLDIAHEPSSEPQVQPIPMRPPPRPAVFGERRPSLRTVEPTIMTPRSPGSMDE
jgi:Flagellar biosynthesis protein, FliO